MFVYQGCKRPQAAGFVSSPGVFRPEFVDVRRAVEAIPTSYRATTGLEGMTGLDAMTGLD